MRETEFAKRRIEHRPDMIRVLACHRLASQQISAVGVAQRQRLAVQAVAGEKPALEIDAPHVVGGCALRKGHARWWPAASHATLDRQSFTIEQRPDRADGRPNGSRHPPLQPTLHLHGSPGRMRPASRQAPLGNLRRHRLWTMQRSARAVDQAFNARFMVSVKPLVASPPAHPEAPANHRKGLFPPLDCHHKAHPLIHRTGLRPHHRQGPPCRSVDLLPMSPVYCVTYVAGLDRFHLSPRAGRGRRAKRGG